MNNLTNIEQNTKEWMSWRAGKIGASDTPIILGLSPYCTPLTLWKRMCGFIEGQKENVAMQRGKDLEPIIRSNFNKVMEMNFVPRCAVHKELEWAIASLDGIDEATNSILEIKCNSKEKHEMVQKGKIPEEHYPQLQWQLFVTDLNKVIYLSHSQDEELVLEVVRNEEYIVSTLLPAATEFLKRVRDFNPPEPMDKDKEYVEINDPEFDRLAKEWREVSNKQKELEKREKELRSMLVEFTDDGNCMGSGIKLTRVNRDGGIDWKKLYEAIVKDYVEILKNEKYDAERYKKQQIGYWKIDEINPKG